MSVRKKFSSLRRPGGVVPQNLLTRPVQKITIPTETTINRGTLLVVKPLSIEYKEPQSSIKSCFFLNIDVLGSGLDEEPFLVVDVDQVDYNSTVITSEMSAPLQLCVSPDRNYVYFRMGNALIDKMVLPRKSVSAAYFGKDHVGAVFVLPKSFGFISISFTPQGGESIYTFLVKNTESWILDTLEVCELSQLQQVHHHQLRRRESSQRDPLTVIRPNESSESEPEDTSGNQIRVSDDVFSGGLPSVLKPMKKRPSERKTRSYTRQEPDDILSSLVNDTSSLNDRDVTMSNEDGEDFILEEPPQIVPELPASFEPPLKYALDGDKKFIITFNDFKTLYNNDWINDTIIDFFIAYEMNKAVSELRSIEKAEVFAFNSFFFTKLFSKNEQQQTPPYYDNIRRWLAKVDLMSFSSVIIPINEHLHWYCVIIKNLPALLEYSKNAKNEGAEDGNEVGNQPSAKPFVEILVIDSLKQAHSTLGPPLKQVIKEYCKDKHDVDISTDLIRLRTARVAKQRNFNDCGIHVIYNIQKWLEAPAVCESIWKTHGKSKSQVFKGTERNNMRRTCIDFLLDLHAKQPPEDPSKQPTSTEEGPSDDEVELISYSTSNAKIAEDEERPIEPTSDGSTSILTEEIGKSANVAGSTISESPDGAFGASELAQRGNDAVGDLIEHKPEDTMKHASLEKRQSDLKELLEFRGVKKKQGLSALLAKEAHTHSNTPMTQNDKPNDLYRHQVRTDVHFRSSKALQDDEESKLQSKTSSNTTGISQRIGPIRSPTPHKTLDPRVIDKAAPQPIRSSKRIETRGLQIQHPQLRRLLLGFKLKKHTADFLNGVFVNHSQRLSDATCKKLHDWVELYNSTETLMGSDSFKRLEKNMKAASETHIEPMEEPFVIKDGDDSPRDVEEIIQDPNDSNGELNKSVGELSISRPESLGFRNESTPEATRHFLLQTEASQVVRSEDQNRHTRRGAKSLSGNVSTNLEIADNDLELVSEVSLVFSSPSEERKHKLAHRSLGSKTSVHEPGPIHVSNSSMTRVSETGHPYDEAGGPSVSGHHACGDNENTKPLKSAVTTRRASDLERLHKATISDNPDVFEVVNIPDVDPQKHSPVRKQQELSANISKKRKVEHVAKRLPGLRRHTQK
ncbi:hypothetical protein OXX69_002892 [Metschnikowia pulcherrima]